MEYNMRKIVNGCITTDQIKEARERGMLEKIISEKMEIDIPLNNEKVITVECAEVTPSTARFVFKDIYCDAEINKRCCFMKNYFQSSARNLILETIYPCFPLEWREIITPRRLEEKERAASIFYYDPLWLPSATDIFGPIDNKRWDNEGDSHHLPIYKTFSSRVKNYDDGGDGYPWWRRTVRTDVRDGGISYPWWLRTARNDVHGSFCNVTMEGDFAYNDTYLAFGIVCGFDI